MNTPEKQIGAPMNRVDGRLKVTGAATYSAEYQLPGITYAVLVGSTITKGRITSIDTRAAERAPGVLAVVTHLNSPKVPGFDTAGKDPSQPATVGGPLKIFHDDKIRFNDQPIAVVVADTFERARFAAGLVQAQYAKEQHQTNLEASAGQAFLPTSAKKNPKSPMADYQRGTADAYKTGALKLESEYVVPTEVHHPMELQAITAHWEAPDRLTLYDKTQGTLATRRDFAKEWGLPEANVKVIATFVGGAFGNALHSWPHESAAIIAAKVVNRPVKLMLTREQMFTMVGYRPHTWQKIGMSATADGKITAITHESIGQTSTFEEFTESTLAQTRMMYASPNLTTRYRLAALDVNSPIWMRGPGEATGAFALESAMDEMAYLLKLDPLEFRLRNYTDQDPENGKPWSSNYLRECYAQGAEKFGWSQRNPTPGATRNGDWLVGQGMAMGIYHASRTKASARARLLPDGTLLLQSATADVGPGTATVMTQIAADASGIAPENIRFELGDAAYPEAPGQFGSHTVASVGAAVHDVCVALKQQLVNLAFSMPGSPFDQVKLTDLVADGGTVHLASHPATSRTYGDVLRQAGQPALEVVHESPEVPEKGDKSGKSFGASFVEVHVHAHTREVRVSRVVSAIDAGRIMNHKTARSQVYGAITWGLGLALMEDAVLDHRFGRITNHDLANYHVPVNADIPAAIDVIFIDKPDDYLDPMGAKGLGEIGIVGFSAAIANAVFNATGKRVRELPITPDKLL